MSGRVSRPDRVAVDCTFLRRFCIGREDDPTVASVIATIGRECPEALARAIRLGPMDVEDTAPVEAQRWLH